MLALFAIPMTFANAEVHTMSIDGQVFDVTYSLDGRLIAMDIDKQSTSLLVGMTDVEDSVFEITFPVDLLAAQGNDFVVLVDGLETEYVVSDSDGKTSITIPLLADSEEIEIIGTSVIPEFPLGALTILGLVCTITILLSKRQAVFR